MWHTLLAKDVEATRGEMEMQEESQGCFIDFIMKAAKPLEDGKISSESNTWSQEQVNLFPEINLNPELRLHTN